MLTITTTILDYEDAIDWLGQHFNPPFDSALLASNQLGAIELALPRLPPQGQQSSRAILIYVENEYAEAIRALPAADFEHINLPSANKLLNEHFVFLGSAAMRVYFQVSRFPLIIHADTAPLRLVFVFKDGAREVAYHFHGKYREEFQNSVQAQGSCAGANFNPWSVYPDKLLDRVKHLDNHIPVPGLEVIPFDRIRT